MKNETMEFLKSSFLIMIIWVIIGNIFALWFFGFKLTEASTFFVAPFGGVTGALLVIVFRGISNEVITALIVLTWITVLVLPAFNSKLRAHRVAILRLQGVFAFLQFLGGLLLVIGSSC